MTSLLQDASDKVYGGSHGESLRGRVLAKAVGRRGHFPEGRLLSGFDNVAPPGNDRAGARLRASEGRGWIQRQGQWAASGTAAVGRVSDGGGGGDRISLGVDGARNLLYGQEMRRARLVQEKILTHFSAAVLQSNWS